MHAEPTSVMDPRDSYLLFILTVFLHACTFFFLQNVASCFKDYISPLDGVVLAVKQEVAAPGRPEEAQQQEVAVPRAVPALKQQYYGGSRFISTNSAANYHALHETLDVSVFR
jgi:hypothetical protein